MQNVVVVHWGCWLARYGCLVAHYCLGITAALCIWSGHFFQRPKVLVIHMHDGVPFNFAWGQENVKVTLTLTDI